MAFRLFFPFGNWKLKLIHSIWKKALKEMKKKEIALKTWKTQYIYRNKKTTSTRHASATPRGSQGLQNSNLFPPTFSITVIFYLISNSRLFIIILFTSGTFSRFIKLRFFFYFSFFFFTLIYTQLDEITDSRESDSLF